MILGEYTLTMSHALPYSQNQVSHVHISCYVVPYRVGMHQLITHHMHLHYP